MARAQSSDFLHSMRFQVAITGGGFDFFNVGAGTTNSKSPSAGFMSCTTPEATTEAVEYREGTYNFPRKFPGNTTVSDISLQKGVARGDGTFWEWLKTVISGSGEYRVDIQIMHFDRRVLSRPQNGPVTSTFQSTATQANAARTYNVYEASPPRHKVAADLDASSSDISIMELDLAYEYFDVVEKRPSSGAVDVQNGAYQSALKT